MAGKLNLDELFRSIGSPLRPANARPPAPDHLQLGNKVARFNRTARYVVYATTYVECDCDHVKAYRQLFPKRSIGKNRRQLSDGRIRNRAGLWLSTPRVQREIRRILQDALKSATEHARLGFKELIEVNEAIICGDATAFLKTNEDGTLKLELPPELEVNQRIAIKRTVVRDGELQMVDMYDRDVAIERQMRLLEAAEKPGAAAAHGVRRMLSDRLREARREREAIEASRGKVVRLGQLPAPKETAG